MNPLDLFASASAITVVLFALVSLGMKNLSLGFGITRKFILLVLASLGSLIFQNLNFELSMFIYVIFQFLVIMILYYSYLRTALYQFLLLPFGIIEEIIVIVSFYFSLFMTFNFLERKHLEKKGNWIILTSLGFLDIAVLLEILNLIFNISSLIIVSRIAFDLFIIWFFSPFILPSELTYEKK